MTSQQQVTLESFTITTKRWFSQTVTGMLWFLLLLNSFSVLLSGLLSTGSSLESIITLPENHIGGNHGLEGAITTRAFFLWVQSSLDTFSSSPWKKQCPYLHRIGNPPKPVNKSRATDWAEGLCVKISAEYHPVECQTLCWVISNLMLTSHEPSRAHLRSTWRRKLIKSLPKRPQNEAFSEYLSFWHKTLQNFNLCENQLPFVLDFFV